MVFKRVGGSLVGVTLLLTIISLLGSVIFHNAIAQQQQPGTTIALILRLLAYISLAALVVCAVMTAVSEQQITRAVLPAIFGIAGLVLVVVNSEYGFSALAAAWVSSTVTFGGEKTEPVWQKNAVMFFGLGGLVAFNVGLASSLSHINTVTMIGIMLGVPAFLMALVYPIQRMQWSWVGILLAVAACGPLLTLIAHRSDIGLLLLPMTAIAAVRGLVWNNDALERHAFGAMAGLGFLMIIGGGTLINTIFSTIPDVQKPLTYDTFNAGINMYLSAGALCFFAWIFSFIYGARHAMWGWFITALLLPAIGAVLLGFFGPTPEDYKQGRESAAAKRAAGV